MAFLILARKKGWALAHRVDRGKDGVEQTTIPQDSHEYRGFGLRPDMTIEEARAQLGLHRTDLKARYSVERRHRIQERVNHDQLVQAAWLPGNFVAEFERDVLKGLTTKPERWQLVKRFIAGLEIGPEEWWVKKGMIIDLLEKRAQSMYSNRFTLKMLNKWGAFYCFRMGKPFSEIPKLTKVELARLRVAYQKNPKRRFNTATMTPDHLHRAEGVLSKEQYAMLALAFWFGLRHEEAESLNTRQGPLWMIQYDDSRFPFVLHVFQQKLKRQGIEDDKCWKAIPACEPEQQALLPLLKLRPLVAPDIKKVDRGLTLRSPRKGFANEMKKRGYRKPVYDIWLGHLGGTTLDLHYEDKTVAYWEPPSHPGKKAS